MAFLLIFFPSPALSDHTSQTKYGNYIEGLPLWCCSTQDCKKVPVKLLGFKGAFAFVDAAGKRYKVKRENIFVTPHKDTWICPTVRDRAMCAMILPQGQT